MKKNRLIVTLLISGALAALGTAEAQVAGSTTTVGISVTELTQVALGWSVKTKDVVKSMPRFDYVSDPTRRAQFVANAEQDIAKAKVKVKVKVADLEKKTAGAAGDAKSKLDQQVTGLKLDLKAAEDKLSEMKRAEANAGKSLKVT